jgi:hypothetical protein
MIFERGNRIRIGMTFWYGGAYELAMYMNAFIQGIIYRTGDIKKLDKSIKDWQLYLYIVACIRYYNTGKMNPTQKGLFYELIKLLMYHISNKITLCVDSIWRLIQGIMYSGGKETSHGDSWLMSLAFEMWIEDVVMRYPHLRPVIENYINVGLIRIIVYGDDHIWSIPSSLNSVLNLNDLIEFLARVLDMELQDCEEFDSFFSIPDDKGGLAVRGPKFLKTYFIENTFGPQYAKVLPYKVINESMLKMFSSDGSEPEWRILRAIGTAWDFRGTNVLGHDYAFEFYERVSKYSKRAPIEIFRDLLEKREFNKKINKIARLTDVSTEQMFDHFPSVAKLMSRHVYNPKMCAYGNKGDWEFKMVQEMKSFSFVYSPVENLGPTSFLKS